MLKIIVFDFTGTLNFIGNSMKIDVNEKNICFSSGILNENLLNVAQMLIILVGIDFIWNSYLMLSIMEFFVKPRWKQLFLLICVFH